MVVDRHSTSTISSVISLDVEIVVRSNAKFKLRSVRVLDLV